MSKMKEWLLDNQLNGDDGTGFNDYRESEGRELGDIGKEDLATIEEIANFLTMDSWDIPTIKDKLLNVWANGHNQGYDDACKEMESK
jgi:hypothetical protein